ncbi:MAG: S8 family peptidase [Gemmatimonadaceae bacterium]|nr:S8 family peptidase [Gemmatimonadaceae bacterium]
MLTRSRITAALGLAALFLAACSDSPNTPTAPDVAASQSVELLAPQGSDYIVVLKEGDRSGVSAATTSIAASVGAQVKDQWADALQGFVATMSDESAERLRRRADVLLVEKDAPMQANVTQLNAPSWGLRRIDDRFLPNDANYTYNKSGAGVHVYIIDTGIRPTHVDFAGRVLAGFSVIAGGVIDCNGHGTHVAGTAAGRTFGVAKNAWIHPVRVLNCAGSGTTAGVIAGVNWVRANRIQPAVANLSLGGGFSAALNLAVNNLVAVGNVATAVAAGNSGLNACTQSPSSATNAVIVGATAINDVRPAWSNFGPCLDLFAPGVNILSDWFTTNVATAVLSGTSMAAPHVAGVLAQVRQWAPAANAAAVQANVVASATPGIVINAGAGSPNRLLYMGYIP